ncbi:MAG TPA: SDR family oxidoreductase [Pseudolabrys sp.]|nr:SDR family oxidoreductase [Pseudolabrys sp.]
MSAAESSDLTGKVIWVIGAAGAIGRGIGDELRHRGATVIGSSRRSHPPSGAEDLWHGWVQADIRNADTLKEALAHIKAVHGRIDGAVVSVTLPIFGDFLDLTAEDWHQVLDTKLLGSVRVVQAVAPALIEAGGGGIVLITGSARGTIAALKHWPGASANVALNFLVHGLSARFAPQNVRINVVAPGPIASERASVMGKLGTVIANTHLQRIGTPAEVGQAVSFLLSPQAAFITGSVLPVDGGGRTPT